MTQGIDPVYSQKPVKKVLRDLLLYKKEMQEIRQQELDLNYIDLIKGFKFYLIRFDKFCGKLL